MTMCYNVLLSAECCYDFHADRNSTLYVPVSTQVGGGAMACMSPGEATPAFGTAMCSCLRSLVRACLVPDEVRTRGSQVSKYLRFWQLKVHTCFCRKSSRYSLLFFFKGGGGLEVILHGMYYLLNLRIGIICSQWGEDAEASIMSDWERAKGTILCGG